MHWFPARKSLLKLIASSAPISRLQTILSIIFVSVLVLFLGEFTQMAALTVELNFLDSLTTLYKIQYADTPANTQTSLSESHLHLKLFRAQRNFYLTGFTLFLALFVHWIIRSFMLVAFSTVSIPWCTTWFNTTTSWVLWRNRFHPFLFLIDSTFSTPRQSQTLVWECVESLHETQRRASGNGEKIWSTRGNRCRGQ